MSGKRGNAQAMRYDMRYELMMLEKEDFSDCWDIVTEQLWKWY